VIRAAWVTASGYRLGDDEEPAADLKVEFLDEGGELSSKGISRIYVHDDRFGPYVRMKLTPPADSQGDTVLERIGPATGDPAHSAGGKVCYALFPLYPKLRLTARELIGLGLDMLPVVRSVLTEAEPTRLRLKGKIGLHGRAGCRAARVSVPRVRLRKQRDAARRSLHNAGMRRWMFGVAVVVVVGCHQPAPSVPVAPLPEPSPPALRLPRDFTPTGYDARLDIDPALPQFTGAIQIRGRLTQRSTVIWLNAKNLEIHAAVARRAGLPDVALTAKPSGEFLSLRPEQPLEAGAWTIAIDYTGALDSHDTAGAFREVYGRAAYAYTQFEPTYARRVFPCIDEPDRKVPWQLTLDVPARLVAVGNAPAAAETPLSPGKKRVEFAPTPPLPSYLVAFAVGPFELVDAGKTRRGTPIRVITLAHRAPDGAYAARTAPALLGLLEDYLGSPYPYPKLDLIAVPTTSGFEAMENAGLVTFAEAAMLFPSDSTSARQFEWIWVAAHELAHQWLGDLVTMAYWDDLWLNEGLATWLAPKIVEQFAPAWHGAELALVSRANALAADAEATARRIHQPIAGPDDVITAFDRITYDKAASVLAMFESYVGADVFQRGVRRYLAAHAWRNATSADFVAAIGEAAGKDLAPAFASFLDQTGTPELTLTVSCTTGGAAVAIAQQRSDVPGSATQVAARPWIVPVCIAYDRTGGRGEACTLLDGPTGSLALDTRSCPRWVLPNASGHGYYRSALTEAQAAALRDEGWSQLSWSDRRAAFHDLAYAAAIGKQPLPLALSLVPKLLDGGDRFAIGAAVALPTSLSQLVPDDLRSDYEAWIRRTFGPAAERAGLLAKRADTLDDEIARSWLVSGAAWVGRDPKLIDDATKLANNWHTLPTSIRRTVLTIGVDTSPALFEQTMTGVAAERDRVRRWDMLWALASARDPERQARALRLILDARLDLNDTLRMLSAGSGTASRARAQAYFREHQAALLSGQRQGGAAVAWAPFVALFTDTCDADQRDAIAAYVRATFGSLPGAERTIAQHLEQMDQCIAERKLLAPAVRAWLTGLGP